MTGRSCRVCLNSVFFVKAGLPLAGGSFFNAADTRWQVVAGVQPAGGIG